MERLIIFFVAGGSTVLLQLCHQLQARLCWGCQIVINTTQHFAAQSEGTEITAETTWEIKLQQWEVLSDLNSQSTAVGSVIIWVAMLSEQAYTFSKSWQPPKKEATSNVRSGTYHRQEPLAAQCSEQILNHLLTHLIFCSSLPPRNNFICPCWIHESWQESELRCYGWRPY